MVPECRIFQYIVNVFILLSCDTISNQSLLPIVYLCGSMLSAHQSRVQYVSFQEITFFILINQANKLFGIPLSCHFSSSCVFAEVLGLPESPNNATTGSLSHILKNPKPIPDPNLSGANDPDDCPYPVDDTEYDNRIGQDESGCTCDSKPVSD